MKPVWPIILLLHSSYCHFLVSYNDYHLGILSPYRIIFLNNSLFLVKGHKSIVFTTDLNLVYLLHKMYKIFLDLILWICVIIFSTIQCNWQLQLGCSDRKCIRSDKKNVINTFYCKGLFPEANKLST